MDEEKTIWISTPIRFNHIYDKAWKEQYGRYFETKMKEINITIDEAIDKYGIRKDEIGFDRGIMFNRVAMKIDKMGNYRVVEYLPRGCNSRKNNVDFYINIISKDQIMATIIKLSRRIEALGYKLGDEVNVIKLDLNCPVGLIYRCNSKKTRDLWFRENELKV